MDYNALTDSLRDDLVAIIPSLAINGVYLSPQLARENLSRKFDSGAVPFCAIVYNLDHHEKLSGLTNNVWSGEIMIFLFLGTDASVQDDLLPQLLLISNTMWDNGWAGNFSLFRKPSVHFQTGEDPAEFFLDSMRHVTVGYISLNGFAEGG